MKRATAHLRAHRAGLTLIEMLQTIGLTAIIVIIVGGMLLIFFRAFYLYSTRSKLITTAVETVTHIGDELAPAYSLEASRTVGSVAYASDQDSIIVKEAAINAAGTPIADVYDYIVIARDATNPQRLMEIIDADPASSRTDAAKLLHDAVIDVTFTYRDASPTTTDTVTFTVTTRTVVQRTALVYTLHAHAKLRNK